MKTNLMKYALLLTGLLGPSAVHAESLHAHIPFSFAANGTILPAGDYIIDSVLGSSSVLLLEGASTKVMVFARIKDDAPSTKTPMTFMKEGSDTAALVEVSTASHTFELSLGSTGRGSNKTSVLAISSSSGRLAK